MTLPAGNNINASDRDVSVLPSPSSSPSSSSTVTCLPGPQPSIFAIIGASVGGVAVLLALFLMILLIRDRRRYRRQVSQFSKSISSNTDSNNEKRITPQVIDIRNSSIEPQPSLLQPFTIIRSFTSRHLRASSDIPDDELLLPPSITRHLRAPADVPADLNSRCSTVSSESYYPSVYETETKVPLPAVIAQPLSPRGLPTSPRDVFRGNISRSSSRATSRAPSRATSKRSIA